MVSKCLYATNYTNNCFLNILSTPKLAYPDNAPVASDVIASLANGMAIGSNLLPKLIKGATSRTAHARILTIILKKLAQPFQVCRVALYSKFILIYLRHP